MSDSSFKMVYFGIVQCCMFPKFLISVHEMQPADIFQLEKELKETNKDIVEFEFKVFAQMAIHFEPLKDEAKKEGFQLSSEHIHTNIKRTGYLRNGKWGELLFRKKINLNETTLISQLNLLKEIADVYGSELVTIEVR